MFTVCSAQLVSTQPANEGKKNLALFVHSSEHCADDSVSSTNKGSRYKEELVKLG